MIAFMNEPLTFDRYFGAPRLSGLRLSPDGRRLVVTVSRQAPDGKSMRRSIWQVDPEGRSAPRRLTASSAGESYAAFARDGSLLFTSSRPDPDAKPDPDHEIDALWMLPPDGGEARLLLAPEGGVGAVAAARNADAIAFGVLVHPHAASLENDAARAKARKEAGVGALLFEEHPIRYWDHWLAPQRQRLFAAPLPTDGDATDGEAKLEPTDVTGDPGPVFMETEFDLSPDGRTIVTSWSNWSKPPATPTDLVALDVETKARRTLEHFDGEFNQPRISPDGRWVVSVRTSDGNPDLAAESMLWLTDLTGVTPGRALTPRLDLWPTDPVWGPDSSVVFFTADYRGGVAAFRVHVASGAEERLVSEGQISDLCPSPDGLTMYALWGTMSLPARIVRFESRGADQTVVGLSRSIDDGGIAGRGRVERLVATAADGHPVESWLVLPPEDARQRVAAAGAAGAAGAGAGPVPLVVMAHGGPIGSWTGWHWRWNPHLFTERGYAVLLPDPAISIGYGQEMVQRGWGRWGEAPYTDIMTAIDSALARPDLDASRVALTGGSYGGYMANWMAGHTDRFRAIVTHASLWDLRPFHGTTDDGPRWEHEMGDPYADPDRYDRQSPATFLDAAARFRTPILVIHGERDFRVPVSEALRLWTDMHRHGIPGRFLYFPDENHWVLKPQNARIWYETVLAFLDEHVLGKEWVRPALL
jgi:dipeptidyl aminopeptidase/acylaminoacyl peptidase